MSKLIDLTGQRFGRLTVVGRGEDYIRPNGRPQVRWNCICDCGNRAVLRGYSLQHGKALSCGCLQREQTKVSNKRYNSYRVDGELVLVKLSNSNMELICDKDVWFGGANQYCWSLSHVGYAFARSNVTGRPIYFHSLVFPDRKDGMWYDHIDGNRLNNTRNNLRFVTPRENTVNRGISKNNTSGYTGVYWYKRDKKWRAAIRVKGEDIHLGYFLNKEDAIAARKQAEIKYFGEYRRKD